MTMMQVALAFLVGFNLWFLWEYLLHRFAMHALHGKGIMSREHLEHHVKAMWSFDYTHILSWIGVAGVGGLLWYPVGYRVGGVWVAWALSIGWACGYAFYEYEHAAAHLRPPRNRYERWVRKNHFEHHFGSPKLNQGVSVGWWDSLFGTKSSPEVVRVPRRLAAGLAWLLDDDGELKPEFQQDYVLVGSASTDERQDGIDRAKAFASITPDP